MKESFDYNQESLLIVDDDPTIRSLLLQFFEVIKLPSYEVANGLDALTILHEKEFTFLLTDMKMPEMSGFQLIEEARNNFPDISIIAMTGYAEGYRYVDVINAGASDFIKKPFDLEELEAKLRRIISERNLRKELSRLSITDSLTGLFNQRHFYTRLHEEITRSVRQKHPLALILLDLDNFKNYNDAYGHLAGDEILRGVGLSINKSIRQGVDSGYRYGGDEFAVILIDADAMVADEITRRILQSLRDTNNITASVGYAIYSKEMDSSDFVSEADKKLYEAKDKRQLKRK